MTVDYLSQNASAAGPRVAVLLVKMGERQYGLPLECVERVMPMAHVLQVPDTGAGLLGMLNVHGQVLPVVDSYARLGLATPAMAAAQRLVLLRTRIPFLVWVDDVLEVAVSDPDTLSEVPAQRTSAVVSKVLRLGETLVPMLAPTALEPRGPVQ